MSIKKILLFLFFLCISQASLLLTLLLCLSSSPSHFSLFTCLSLVLSSLPFHFFVRLVSLILKPCLKLVNSFFCKNFLRILITYKGFFFWWKGLSEFWGKERYSFFSCFLPSYITKA